MTPERDLQAQFLYQGVIEGYEGTEPICGEGTGPLIDIYGYTKEIELGPCEIIVDITVPWNDYSAALKPRILE